MARLLWLGLLVAIVPMVGSCNAPFGRCAGTLMRCGYWSANQCTAVPGCSLVAACADLDASNCQIASDVQCMNGSMPGCYWQDKACLGPCDNISQAACAAIAGCAWEPCTGIVPACSSFSTSQCPTTFGCYVEGFD